MNLIQQQRQRPAFIFTMAIMLGLAFLGIAVFLAIMTMFIQVIVPTIPDVLTDVPTLYDYDEFGQRISTIEEFGMTPDEIQFRVSEIRSEIELINEQMGAEVKNKRFGAYQILQTQKDILQSELEGLDFRVFSQPNQLLELYWLFGYPSILILFIFIMFSVATHYWEKSFSIFKLGTSATIIKSSVFGIVAILLVPEFWDTYAIYMKQFSMYLLDPFDGNPHLVTSRLWCKMGCIVNIDRVLDQDVWEIALANPSNFGQELLTNALLPLFKAIPTAMLSISLFIIAKIRVLFIMIVLLTLPLWFVAMNLPFLKKHANDMMSNMVGASIAPIFSALTLFVGLYWVDSRPVAEHVFMEWWICQSKHGEKKTFSKFQYATTTHKMGT
ncbi:MAG: hypothetical protein HRU07_05775 [Nitrosopumilus sp.]|nr:hypothetical protein [Nitrosopumilus sp.]NRA05655.1 hypothetical protein [Nitrosopumilus sp.]